MLIEVMASLDGYIVAISPDYMKPTTFVVTTSRSTSSFLLTKPNHKKGLGLRRVIAAVELGFGCRNQIEAK